MPILTYPHSTLRQPSRPVTKVDRRLTRLLQTLYQNLTQKNLGLGLAAPQLGYNYRLFAINTYGPQTKTSTYKYFLNPKIERESPTLTLGPKNNRELEGCLSVPKIYAPIYRPQWLELTYQILDENSCLQTKHEKFTDATARVIAHETDHLDGILFIDHALKQNVPLYLENAHGDLDEITPAQLLNLLGTF